MYDLTYDLHIHSCLSPCGDEDMTPGNIAGMAAIKELDVIAVTDHNSCKNCASVMAIADNYDVLVLPGMELTTMEEVHVVCLFSDLKDAMAFDAYVDSQLMPFPNNEKIFGRQIIRDIHDEVCGSVSNLLINATNISFDDVFGLMKDYNGIMIPAHIDKNSNSLISNLGFVPPDSRFTCVELKNTENFDALALKNPYLTQCKVITNSDAHYLEDINEPVNRLTCKRCTAKDVFETLKNN